MSAVIIFERLLQDESVTSKEHVMETASPKVADVEDRLNKSFDTLVQEISAAWGGPQFNSRQSLHEEEPEITEEPAEGENAPKKKLKSVLPSWSNGTARSGGTPKVLRLTYWKRPESLSYIALRTELDERKNNKPLHFEIVLGSRRRNPETTKPNEKLRHTEEHWLSKLTKILSYLAGR